MNWSYDDYDPTRFARIEEARERWIEGGSEYEEWRARIHAEDEEWGEEEDEWSIEEEEEWQ